MKKKHIIYLFFLFFFSCNRTIHLNNEAHCHYHSLVNNAEMKIIQGELKSAIALYKIAFKKYPGFASDNYNAFLCSYFVSDFDFATENANKLVQKGICIEFFKSFPKMIENNFSWIQVTKEIVNQKQINSSYRRELEQLLSDDQSVRPVTSNNFKIVQKTDSINYEKFKNLISQFGYPSEELIGIKCTDNFNGIAPQPHQILIRHFYQRGYFDLDSIIQNGIKNFKLKPEEFANYTAFVNTPNKRFDIEPISVIDNKYYEFVISDSMQNIISKNRNSICLFSRSEQIEKIKYRIKNKNSEFRIPQYSPISYLNDLPKEFKDSLIKNVFKPISF